MRHRGPLRSLAAVKHLAFAAALLLPAAASAHERGFSLLQIDAAGRAVEASLAFHADEFAGGAQLDRDRDGGLSDEEIASGREALIGFSLRPLGIAVGDAPCILERATVERDPTGGVVARGAFRCPEAAESGLFLSLGHLESVAPGHRTIGEARVGGAVTSIFAGKDQPRLELAGAESAGGRLIRFFLLGIEHIFTGYDHLLFLAALLLTARRGREIALLVTAFTVAHSLTLGGVALGLLQLPGAWVEPAIAASIVLVAAENVLWPGHRSRALLAFAFGLIHGFGFAGLLSELGMGQGALVFALLGFNVGVEAGQLALVLACAPLLALARQRAWYPRIAVPCLSAAIAFAGTYWLVEQLTS